MTHIGVLLKMDASICPKLEPIKLHPSLKIDFFWKKSILLIFGGYKAHMAKWDFGASEGPFRFLPRWCTSVFYMKMNAYICPKHFPKNLCTQLEPKKLHPSLKIDFFEKSQFCSCLASIRLIWRNEILEPRRCLSAFCPDDAHQCSIWKWMLSYVPNTPRKDCAPNWSRKNYILAGKSTFLKNVRFAHAGRL